jgi:hypothetical protein
VHRLGRPSARGPAPVCSQCVEDETANIAVPGNPAFPASLSVEWRAYGDVRPTGNGAVYSRFGSISPVPARSRGRPAADLEALEDALMRVSYLAMVLPQDASMPPMNSISAGERLAKVSGADFPRLI